MNKPYFYGFFQTVLLTLNIFHTLQIKKFKQVNTSSTSGTIHSLDIIVNLDEV